MNSPNTILRRTKSKWFARGRSRDPATIASVVAFTAWRLGLESIKRLRQAQFEIEASSRYFDYLAEYLVFLVQLADRIAQPHYTLEQRTEFVTFIVRRLGGNLAENRARLLGDDMDATRRAFIDRYNARADEYAEYGFGADGPDAGFVRHCAHALFAVFEPADRIWLIDQLMSYETPAAVKTLRAVFANLIASAQGEAGPQTPEGAPFPPAPE